VHVLQSQQQFLILSGFVCKRTTQDEKNLLILMLLLTNNLSFTPPSLIWSSSTLNIPTKTIEALSTSMLKCLECRIHFTFDRILMQMTRGMKFLKVFSIGGTQCITQKAAMHQQFW
jgi:hypothetical protein